MGHSLDRQSRYGDHRRWLRRSWRYLRRSWRCSCSWDNQLLNSWILAEVGRNGDPVHSISAWYKKRTKLVNSPSKKEKAQARRERAQVGERIGGIDVSGSPPPPGMGRAPRADDDDDDDTACSSCNFGTKKKNRHDCGNQKSTLTYTFAAARPSTHLSLLCNTTLSASLVFLPLADGASFFMGCF